MGDTRGADHPHAVQLDVLGTHPVEQSDAAAEQHGHQVKLQLVKQSRLDELAHDIRAAPSSTSLSSAAACAWARALAIPSVTKV
jgi:hypothetical protein